MVINQVEFPKNGKQRPEDVTSGFLPLNKEIVAKTLLSTCSIILQHPHQALRIALKSKKENKSVS